MREYVVIWQPRADIELESALLSLGDPKAILDAAIRIDEQLAIDPYQAGESRDPPFRIVIDPPLQVFAEVDFRAKIVYVYRAALWFRIKEDE